MVSRRNLSNDRWKINVILLIRSTLVEVEIVWSRIVSGILSSYMLLSLIMYRYGCKVSLVVSGVGDSTNDRGLPDNSVPLSSTVMSYSRQYRTFRVS